jgi:hypothetical protein
MRRAHPVQCRGGGIRCLSERMPLYYLPAGLVGAAGAGGVGPA